MQLDGGHEARQLGGQRRPRGDPGEAGQSQRDRIDRALRNRDLIGQAKGILMSRHGVSADAAFEMLRTRSQHTNCKLVAVAEQVVETGSLEGRAG